MSTRLFKPLIIVSSSLSLLSACEFEQPKVSLVETESFESSESCPSGGVRIYTGVDENDNGRLDNSEIDDDQTEEVCNGDGEENAAPEVNNQQFSGRQNGPIAETIVSSDADGDELSHTLNAFATSGTVSVAANGDFIYTPETDFVGEDSFEVLVQDNNGGSDTATITIKIEINEAPKLISQAYSTDEDTRLTATLEAEDPNGDEVIFIDPDPDDREFIVYADGSFEYNPEENFTGTLNFTVEMSDGDLDSEGTFSITVNAINDAPEIEDQEFRSAVNETLEDTITAEDIDGDALTFSLESEPEGHVELNADGSFVYEPINNSRDEDRFEVSVSDGQASAKATMTIVMALEEITLTNDNIYSLASGYPGTYIGNGDANDGDSENDVFVELDIEAGTLLLGDSQEALLITRGSSIEVHGTAANPVVMSSRTQFDSWVNGNANSNPGEWGGLVITGYGQSNKCSDPENCELSIDGINAYYGGNNDNDTSGSISYLVVRNAGGDIDGEGSHLSGISYYGVGSGTAGNHIQVHKSDDDGIEYFASTNHLSHMVLTEIDDDSIDWSEGYRGSNQFVVVKQGNNEAGNAIEASNNLTDNNASPISQPTLANLTLVGQTAGAANAQGILLNKGTGGNIYNTIVTDFAGACLDIDDDATFERAYSNDAYTGDLSFDNSFIDCNNNFKNDNSGSNGKSEENIFAESGANNSSTTEALLTVSLMPSTSFADAVTAAEMALDLGGNFQAVDYAGAYDPNAENQWSEGWTLGIHNNNNSVWQPVDSPVADGSCPTGTALVETLTLPDIDGDGNSEGEMDLCQLQRRYE